MGGFNRKIIGNNGEYTVNHGFLMGNGTCNRIPCGVLQHGWETFDQMEASFAGKIIVLF